MVNKPTEELIMKKSLRNVRKCLIQKKVGLKRWEDETKTTRRRADTNPAHH